MAPIALVTGGARRIGRAIALDLAGAGWRVAVHHHRSADEAQETVRAIESGGGKAATLQADLCDLDAVHALIPACREVLGFPTLLVNNASTFTFDAIESLEPATWQAQFDLHLRAPVFLARDLAAALPDDAEASIVNLVDQRVWKPTPEFFSYTLSKSALWTATQTLAQALAPRIRVNAIGPGPVLANASQSREQFERRRRATPLGIGAEPEEICAAIRFLIATPSVTGQMIALDGGQHLAWRTGDTDRSER